MIKNIMLLIIMCSNLLVLSNAGIIHPLTKCSVLDGECKKQLYQNLFIQKAGGDTNTSIPSVSPLILVNVEYVYPKNVKLILENGVVNGIKGCKFKKMQTYFKQPFHSILNLTCDLNINGIYNVEFPQELIKDIGGEDLGDSVFKGSGNGTVIISNIHFSLKIPFEIETINNEMFVHVKDLNISTDGDENVSFSIKDLDIGYEVNNKKIASYLAEHATEANFMTPVTDKILEFFEAFVENFLRKVPAKTLFNGDFASYS